MVAPADREVVQDQVAAQTRFAEAPTPWVVMAATEELVETEEKAEMGSAAQVLHCLKMEEPLLRKVT